MAPMACSLIPMPTAWYIVRAEGPEWEPPVPLGAFTTLQAAAEYRTALVDAYRAWSDCQIANCPDDGPLADDLAALLPSDIDIVGIDGAKLTIKQQSRTPKGVLNLRNIVYDSVAWLNGGDGSAAAPAAEPKGGAAPT